MKSLLRFINGFAAILVPIILVLVAVRVLLSPLFIQIEYRLPGFPPDPYGFTFADRMYWANISRVYLLNREGIEYLGNQQLDSNTPLYNQRELQHMLDVKVVVGGAMWVLGIAVLLEVGIWYINQRAKDVQAYRQALSKGGWLTTLLILSVLVYLALNFNSLFTNFHRIFFDGDSWLFQYSDTLIRLFPLLFWRDAFIWIAVMSLIGGIGLGYFCGKPRRS